MARDFITPKGDEGIYQIDTASWRTYKPVMDKDICVECGICLTYCPVNSIHKENEKYIIDLSYCKGCGICANECPKKAIDMVTEGDK